MINKIKEEMYEQVIEFKEDTNTWLIELKENSKKLLNEIHDLLNSKRIQRNCWMK
jgi:hypothetical protein